MKRYLFLLLLASSFASLSQSGSIKGTVNDVNGEAIPFCSVFIEENSMGANSDLDGKYAIEPIPVGVYSLKVSSVGFKPIYITDIEIRSGLTVSFTHVMEQLTDTIETVTVQANPFTKKVESPTGYRTLNATEIQRYPGANRDVSKVIQSLPGVAQLSGFRNDIIVRGGSSGENKFYLDGFEVPNINHFATQGAGGGPVGMLNVNFINKVDFYASSFPSNYANSLSSVLSFKQKNGNPDRVMGSATIGLSDAALTVDGPIGEKADFLLSTRVSYQQLLFKLLKLPFLPTYYDAQFKFTYRPTKKDKLTFIGLGAWDKFRINKEVNDGETDEEVLKRNNYILRSVPINDQWNYTLGAKYEHRAKKSRQIFYFSQNRLNNGAYKYQDNDESSEDNLIFNYKSVEVENKFRFENVWNVNGWKVTAGLGYEWARYTNETFSKIVVNNAPSEINISSKLDVHKMAFFGQVTKSFFKEYLTLTAGLRGDFSPYNKKMINPLEQLSPTIGAKVKIYKTLMFNASASMNHQLPAYTILGYRVDGELVNQENLKYMRVQQYSGGFEYTGKWNGRFTVEGFYKNYLNYPFSIDKGISLANLGADFGVVGNEAVNSDSKGRSYGLEFLYQQKMKKGYYGIISYTFVNSAFENQNQELVSSSWDSRHILSASVGKRFKKGWEVGMRFTYSGGAPYTPLDIATSTTPGLWEINSTGYLDYSKLNSQRAQNFHQLDIRVDKKFNFKKWSLNLYLDIQNVYNFKAQNAPTLYVETDDNGQAVIDPSTGKYSYELVDNISGRILPTIGLIFEFPFSKKKAN